WISRPDCLSPSNCAISERSIPSPASAVPSSSLAISSVRFGRRSPPSNAILASFAMPILSEHSARAASDMSSALASMGQPRQFPYVGVREQELDLRNGLRDAIELAMQSLRGDDRVLGPALRDETRADAEAKRCGRLAVLPLDPHWLAGEAAPRQEI